MNRRQLLQGCLGLLALSQLPSTASAETIVDYSPDVYKDALASGEPFLLDFYASW